MASVSFNELGTSPERQNMHCLHFTDPKVNTGIVNINKHSSFEGLLKSTEYLYKFLNKIKDCDPKRKALEYWVKVAQAEYFQKELNFLSNSNSVNASNNPHLVSNLNLFIDPKGIIRSRGRISKCHYFKYEILNPVLLPREHRLTTLFINDCHLKMQHLGIGITFNYIRE